MKNNLFLILIVSFLLPSNFIDRFKVPIYTKSSISIGYDSNFLRFSEYEMDNFSDDVSSMGGSETYDSDVYSPAILLEYSPNLISKYETKFLFSYKKNIFRQSDKKTFDVIKSELGIHLKRYSWLKFGYRLVPSYYLREYRDLDLPEIDDTSCSFISEGLFVSYSLPISKKGNWVKIKLSQTNLLYDTHFTEYDTKITKFSFYNYFKIFKVSTGIAISYSDGENSTYDSGYISTRYDRSYNEYAGSLELSKKAKKKRAIINKYGAGFVYKYRDYLSESESDPLHSGRSHQEINHHCWIEKNINTRLGVQLMLKIRNRIVDSSFDWVSDLKSFSKYSMVLTATYDFDIDILY